MYGRGASYDAIEGQFRKYRRAAEQIKSEAAASGITIPPRGRNAGAGGTPRTPRGPRGSKNGVSKTTPSSGRNQQSKLDAKIFTTPSKKSSFTNRGQSVLDAISLDDCDSDISMLNIKTPVKVKTENIESASSFTSDNKTESSAVLSSIENVREDKDKQLHATDSLLDIKQERVNSQTNGYVDSAAAFSATETAVLDGSFISSFYTDVNPAEYADLDDDFYSAAI